MSQEELAYKSKLSVRTISRLEQNGESCTLKSLRKISKALDMEIGEIIKEMD